MLFYAIFTFLLLITLPFFPKQLDVKVNSAIYIFALSLLPIFFKNLKTQLTNKNPTVFLFIFFLISGLASTFYSLEPRRSFWQLLLNLSYFIIFISVGSVFKSPKSKEKLALVLLLATSILSALSLYHTLFLHYVNRQSEGISFFWVYYGHNHLSALLIFSLPLACYFLKTYWQKRVFRIFFLLTIFYLLFSFYFTFARASAISLLAAFVISAFFFRFLPRQKMIALLVFLALIALLLINKAAGNAGKFGVAKYELTSKTRIVYWQQALDNFINRPLVGSGLDTFRFVNKNSQRKAFPSTYFAHNFFLQMLSDAGLVGFISSFSLIFAVLWNAFGKTKEKLKTKEGLLLVMFWTGLLASSLNSLVDFDWQLPAVFFIFWLVASLFKS